MAQRSTEKRRFKEVFRRAPQETLSLVRVQLGEPRKKALANASAFFSYIRLWRVVLLRSGIMLCIVILPAAAPTYAYRHKFNVIFLYI